MELALGLDVGTTTVKGGLFTREGIPLAFASRKVNLLIPQPGWVEQDPQELWRAVIEICRQLVDQLPAGGKVCAISLSSQGGTTIPLDAGGNPTHPAFSWMDGRAVDQASSAAASLGEEWIYRTTGWSLMPGLPLNHIAWFRQNCPQKFRRTARFAFVNDYILARLGGQYWMDPSNASITQLYNLLDNAWDRQLLDFAGIREDQLSPIRSSGAVVSCLTLSAAEQTGLEAGVPLVNGAHDQYCAAVAAGVTYPGEVLLSCGTAWVILVVPDRFQNAFCGGMCISRHAVSGLWGGIRSMGGVGTSVEWLLDQIWGDIPQRTARFDALDRALAGTRPGAKGLIFIPLSGGHAVSAELSNRGLLNLSLDHTRGDVARALLEGITYELDWMLEDIRSGFEIKRMKMIGGASRNPIWGQIIADVTGLPVELPSISETASLGAALLAGVGVGWYPDIASAAGKWVLSLKQKFPHPATQLEYQHTKQRYRRLWQILHEEGDFRPERKRLP